jgi:hypothetical protein
MYVPILATKNVDAPWPIASNILNSNSDSLLLIRKVAAIINEKPMPCENNSGLPINLDQPLSNRYDWLT